MRGGVLNVAELARASSLDAKTAARYVDILTGAFLVRRLPPWFEKTGKRVVKSPKVYLRDTGLLHALLALRDGSEVLSHPRFGASWEGFALEQVIRFLAAERDAYFWATHAGAELDLLVVRGEGAMASSSNMAMRRPPPSPCARRWRIVVWKSCSLCIPVRGVTTWTSALPCCHSGTWASSGCSGHREPALQPRRSLHVLVPRTIGDPLGRAGPIGRRFLFAGIEMGRVRRGLGLRQAGMPG